MFNQPTVQNFFVFRTVTAVRRKGFFDTLLSPAAVCGGADVVLEEKLLRRRMRRGKITPIIVGGI